jgi:hypothetical protein
MGIMIDNWKRWTAAVADYTVGTVIVMIHMATAQRIDKRLYAAPSDLDMRMKWQGSLVSTPSVKGSVPHSS